MERDQTEREKLLSQLHLLKATTRSELARITEFQQMNKVLMEDLVNLSNSSEVAESQAQARSFVRAAFAMIEGGCFGLKQITLKLIETRKVKFSSAEIAMLEENSYDIDNKGQALATTKFIPLSKNVKFAFSACAKACEMTNTLDTSGAGWASFKNALKVRNRLTHPKQILDLQVSEKELDDVVDATEWFMENT